MARINTYSQDASVTKNDKLIGSDSGGDTRNFSLESVADFLNTSSLINVNGQLVYKFKGGSTPDDGEFNKGGGGTASFSAITSFVFSHLNTNNQNIETYLNYFNGLRIMLTQTDNQNNFGLYSVDSITSGGEGSTHSTFGVTFIEGNGSMIVDKHYAMAYSPKGQTDKNFVSNSISFTANTAQTITHNLNKFPSVTTVDSGGSHVVGDIQHIDTNSFRITFTASFTGKVYVN